MNNHIKIYLKHLANNKLYTFVTIFGFAVSLMFVLLLGVYIQQELSVDQFHTKKGRLYRLYRSYENWSGFAPPVGAFIKDRFPEVENYCRISYNEEVAINNSGQKFKMNCLLADSSFFSMFSFKLDVPGQTNVLATKNSMVISRSFARKIFGNGNPVGQEIKMQDGLGFVITAVMDDFPGNTHFTKCDAVLNFQVIADLWGWKDVLTSYGASTFGIYFLERPGTDLPAKAPQIMELFKKDYWIYKDNRAKDLKFESITDVYFSNSAGQGVRQNSKTLIMVFMSIVLLVFCIAVINYVNLTMAQAGFRGKETAIKKLMGSSKTRLIFQYISESVILTSIASLIAILLAFMAEPYFNSLLNTNLYLDSQLINRRFFLLLLITVPFIGFISGLLPAIFITRVNPGETVKGAFSRKTKGTYSKVLIGVQYCIAIILLVCSWGIGRQTGFMRSYNTGFQKDNIFWMESTIDANQKMAFSEVLKAIPGVREISYACGSPIDGGNVQCWSHEGNPYNFREFFVDSAFFHLMGMKITPTNVAYDKKGYYLNHQGLAELELPENSVTFNHYRGKRPVLGIVNDFNFRSLHKKIGPAMIGQMEENQDPWQVFVKISGVNQIGTVDRIKKAQTEFTKGTPMESGFLDQTINQWYQKEERTAKLVGAFTVLAIVISVMGIFAMSLYYIQQKIKEIGIRKVNGAKIFEILTMLNKDFVKWVAIAFIIATPISWYAMHQWLENFAYKTSLSWWIFALAGVLALGIALLTVSWQSWRSATRNPVEALRYE